MAPVQQVGVVGCGTMGSGIAEVSARAGLDVTVAVRTEHSRRAGQQRLQRSIDAAVAKGRLSGADRDQLLDRVRFTLDLADLAGCQLVVEAIREQQEDKTELFTALDKLITDDESVLASTTSCIPIMRLALATSRPERVIGLHFFSPVPAMPLVEVIGSVFTSARTQARAEEFAIGSLAKRPIHGPDQPGFVVNALLVPFLLSAIRMVEAGRVDAATIDQGIVLGCSHPVGPLKLADLVGLDVLAQVADALWEEFGEPQYAPPALLTRMVTAGLLGRKSGRGFYDHRVRGE